MAITNLIKWNIDDVDYELSRHAECRGVFTYQRGDNLPQFFSVQEAAALSMQIRRMVDRSDFVLASKEWTDKSKGG